MALPGVEKKTYTYRSYFKPHFCSNWALGAHLVGAHLEACHLPDPPPVMISKEPGCNRTRRRSCARPTVSKRMFFFGDKDGHKANEMAFVWNFSDCFVNIANYILFCKVLKKLPWHNYGIFVIMY